MGRLKEKEEKTRGGGLVTAFFFYPSCTRRVRSCVLRNTQDLTYKLKPDTLTEKVKETTAKR
jgi:hypothetical protein